MTTSTIENPNVLEWVEALESGEFQQGNYYLRVGDKYCCLGVVCELMARKGLLTRTLSSGGSYAYSNLAAGEDGFHDTSNRVLVGEASEWLGLSPYNGNPILKPGDDHNRPLIAAPANDVTRLSFREIATLIRENGIS